MSSEDAYNEQYAAWHIYKGGPQARADQQTGRDAKTGRLGGA